MLLAKKFFEFHARVQKCHFGKIEKLPIVTFIYSFIIKMRIQKVFDPIMD